MSPTIAEKRAELLRMEIEEVWPSKDYQRLCEENQEQPWASEAEIRAYFDELSEDDVIALWTDSPCGSDEEQMARFLAAYPDGWTCQDCSKEYLPEGDQYPHMPVETDGGTVCPPGTGCAPPVCEYEVTVRAPMEVLLAAHDEVLRHIAKPSGLDVDEVDYRMNYDGDMQIPGDTIAEVEYKAVLKECDYGAGITQELLGMACFDGIKAAWHSADEIERWALEHGTFNEEKPRTIGPELQGRLDKTAKVLGAMLAEDLREIEEGEA